MEHLIVALIVLLHLEIIGVIYILLGRRDNGKNPTFIDTSVLMDGRIITIVRAGFAPDRLYIPSSVLRELQLVADGSDSDKRARARHGLDIAAELTDMKDRVRIINDTAPNGVDESLLALAIKHKGSICTIDFNLNKVAGAQNIPVLNIHELAQQLRALYLPGEKVSIQITQKGNDAHQGVGYMADGTMVVVDNAQSDINHVVTIEIIRSIQTAAGRMLFAKKLDAKKDVGAKKSNGKKQVRPQSSQKNKRISAEDSLINLVEKQ